MPRTHGPSSRLVPWLLALAFAACGGGDPEALGEARLRIDRGEFEVADALLKGRSGAGVEALRAEIAAGIEHRASLQSELQRIAEGSAEHDAQWSLLQFNDLLRRERDPRSEELIRQTQSDVATRVAESRRMHLRGEQGESIEVAALPAAPEAAQPASESSLLARAAVVEARNAQVKGQWKTALALAISAEADALALADARLVHQSILSAARVDAEVVLGRARELERSGAVADGAGLLNRELARFPALDEFESLRFEAQLMNERVSRAAPAANPRRGAPGPTPSRPAQALDGELARAASSEECEALAQWRATNGDLAGAREAWLESARRRGTQPARDESERRARELELRIALREELHDFARVDDETARVLGTAAAADDGGTARFESVPLSLIAPLVERDRLSSKARLGWLVESIVRGDEHERELALQGLGAAVEHREIDALHASSLVARAKGEIGEGGWSFRGGRWVEGKLAKAEAAAEAETARGSKFAQLIGNFRRSSASERDALLEQLRATGDGELLSEALAKRWQDDWERLEKNPNLRQLGELAQDRRALDKAREKALGLIFDEERYFYPYDPPECPPQKAAKYAAVQREVDELVQAVRALWQSSKRVKISAALRQQLADAAWTAGRAVQSDVDLEPVDPTWRFALALPAGDDVGLDDFAWDAIERAALTESDRIEARNQRLWAALERAKPADDVPNSDEQRQVLITNAYRRMLGRRALAWNPRIEIAAQGHSDHMANTGDFSHFEQGDPARRTPFDRLRLAGYAAGVSENITMGRSDPQTAHEGWTHSSGHHRNLLEQSHREMASAIASNYWTQNFGVDTSFLADL